MEVKGKVPPPTESEAQTSENSTPHQASNENATDNNTNQQQPSTTQTGDDMEKPEVPLSLVVLGGLSSIISPLFRVFKSIKLDIYLWMYKRVADPTFNKELVEEGARHAVVTVVDMLARGDMQGLKELVSPEGLEEFKQLIKQLEQKNLKLASDLGDEFDREIEVELVDMAAYALYGETIEDVTKPTYLMFGISNIPVLRYFDTEKGKEITHPQIPIFSLQHGDLFRNASCTMYRDDNNLEWIMQALHIFQTIPLESDVSGANSQ